MPLTRQFRTAFAFSGLRARKASRKGGARESSAASYERKRLARYYDEPGRAEEIRIELQKGSYPPEF